MNIAPAVGRSQMLATLPSYLGIRATTDEVIGVGGDSLGVIDALLQIIGYDRALSSGILSTADPQKGWPSLSYSRVLQQVKALCAAPEEDELGRIRPSDTAVQAARDVAFRMLRLPSGLPEPIDVSTDRDGAIRILWENGTRSLELICPFEPGQKPYLYYSENGQYSIEYDLSDYRLVRLLAWLAGSIDCFPR